MRSPETQWRLWHLRLPWLQAMVTGQPVPPPGPAYQLYEINDGEVVPIDLSRVEAVVHSLSVSRTAPLSQGEVSQGESAP